MRTILQNFFTCILSANQPIAKKMWTTNWTIPFLDSAFITLYRYNEIDVNGLETATY